MAMVFRAVSVDDLSFGQALTHYREQSRITQRQLADFLDVTPGAVSKWEADIHYPMEETLRSLARIFSTHEDFWIYKAGRIPSQHDELIRKLAQQYGVKLPEVLQNLIDSPHSVDANPDKG